MVDCSDLRAAVGLRHAPDHNTLCRAFKRLVTGRSMNRALDVQADLAKAIGLDVCGDDAKPSAMDSTCFESRHVSRHFERRKEETAAKAAAAARTVAKTPGKPAKKSASLTRSKTIKSMPKLSVAVACSP